MGVKSADKVLQQADKANQLGQENSWERSADRYTEDLQTERGSTNIISGVVNAEVRRSTLKGRDAARTAIVMKTTEEFSHYEMALLQNATTNESFDVTGLKKVRTRCAESKAFAGDPSWKFGKNPTGPDLYKKSIYDSLQAVMVVNQEDQIRAGMFVDQIYPDETQNDAKLLKVNKERGILEDLDELAASMNPGSSNSFVLGALASTVAETKTSDTSTLPVLKTPNENALVKEVLEKDIWKPVYNPVVIAVTRWNKVYCWSRFGMRTLGGAGTTTKGTRMHAGIDIGARGLLPICAVADGKVVSVSYPVTTRISIVTIEHSNVKDVDNKGYKVRTAYMHNCKIEAGIEKGVHVKAGDIIAYMGGKPYMVGSGGTTGYHLHFEVRITNNEDKGTYRGAVDPLSFEYPKLLVISDQAAKDIVKALQKEFFNGASDY